jgi:hypothetical protein
MLFTVKEDLTLLRELKLTPKQLMFIKMLARDYSLTDSEWTRYSAAMALEYQTLCPLSHEELEDLLKREIIIDYNVKGQLYYDSFEINPKYLKKFVLQVTGLPSQLWEAYPYRIVKDNFEFFAKTASAEEIAKDYLKAIGKKSEEHEKVLDDLQWAVKNNMLPVGLKQFVASRYWLFIRDQRSKFNPKSISDVKLG